MTGFSDIITSSFNRRKDLFGQDGCNVFRLVNGEGDGAGALFADLYGEYILLQSYTPEAEQAVYSNIEPLISAVKALPTAVKGILLKKRDDKASAQESYDSSLLWGIKPPENYFVIQNGMKMNVDLIHGLNSGLFLDMRQIREKIGALYPEIETMLNLFSYTCAFALHARMHGVTSAINVDVSKTVLRRGMENYQLNGIHSDNRDFIQEDCGRWLKRAAKKDRKWDLTVFDPPTFSRGKTGSFSVKTDYSEYLDYIGSITGKYCLSVINTHTITRDEYISFHPESWSNVWLAHESDDFPNAENHYLKVGLWSIS